MRQVMRESVADESETMPGQGESAYALLRHALMLFEKPPAELDEEQLAQVRQQVARETVIQDAVLETEQAAGVQVTSEQIDAAVEELRARYDNREEFLADLARNGLNKACLREGLARELKVAAVLELVEQEVPAVTDAEVEAYYDQHRDRFVYPETREARHILITVNDDYRENSRANALKRIQQIGWGIGRKPDRFGEQACRHSECPTAMQEGKLGRVRPGQLFPELDAVLFAMQEGEISQPVESEMGFHLLLCERIHPAGEVTLQQAAERIRQLMQKSKNRRHLHTWLESLSAGM